MTRDGTALGCIALCAHCKYAIQLRRCNRVKLYEPGPNGEQYSESFDYWEHFVRNDFTCHTAAPCPEVGWRYDYS